MSEVKFIVRDAHRTVSSTWHGSCADRAVAALSADPVTIEELEIAIGRYMKPRGDGRCFRCFGGSLDDEPYDAGLVVIDLAARLIAVESSYSSPGRKGTVWYHNGECATNTPIRYQLADEWLITSDVENWRHLAEKRRREREAQPPLDARAVLFGRPLVEFLAAECFAAFARREEFAEATRIKWIANAKERAVRWPETVRKDPKYVIATREDGSVELRDPETMTLEELAPSTWTGQERYASPFYNALKGIHVAWLMTPRADLRGEIPREVLLAQHDHISSDLGSRCEQWSWLDFCPRGLDTTSHAVQFGGFGTHELVKYYDLVRELLWSCWERLTGLAQSPHASQRPESLMRGDFLTGEVPRLEQVRDEWLNAPDPECHFRTPRSIIDRERQRLPESVSGHDAMVDSDCPCCQMLADMPGPTFWHLDGSHMEWDFAFSIYCRTREEWEAEQRDYEEFSRKCDARDAERRRLGMNDPADGQHPAGSVWSSSYSIDDSPNIPLGIRLFGIGGHLAELITDLREPPKRREQMESCESPAAADPQPLIDQLNRDFGNLREVLTGAESALSASLVEPVLDHFAETLDAVAAERPDLNPKCGALFAKLKNFLEPPNPELPELFPDDDVPF